MHRLSEIDSIENPDTVSVLQKGLAAVDYDIAFRVIRVKIENRSVTYNFRGLKIIRFHIITHQPLHLILQGVLALCAEMNADDIGGAAHSHAE